MIAEVAAGPSRRETFSLSLSLPPLHPSGRANCLIPHEETERFVLAGVSSRY